jgi:hypothetical protein
MADVCIFGGHLDYFTAFWFTLWQFGNFFPRFGMLYHEKSGNPGSVHFNRSGQCGGFIMVSNLSTYLSTFIYL